MENIVYFYSEGETIEINVKNIIPLNDMVNVARMIADAVIDNNEYHPELFEFTYWAYVLREFTDANVENDVDKMNSMIWDDEFITNLSDHISQNQLNAIRNAAQDIVQARISEHPLKGICDKIKVTLDDLIKILERILADDDIKNAIDELLENFDFGDIKRLISEVTEK